MLHGHDMKTVLQAVRELQWGLLTALVIFLIAALGFYHGLLLLDRSEVWVAHTHEVLEHLQDVQSEMETIESTYRGFALTGKESSLERYRPDVLLAIQDEKSLRELTSDNPSQQRLLPVLNRIIEQKLQFADSIIQLRRSSGLAVTSEALRGGQGERIMAEFHAVMATMIEEEQRLLRIRDAEAQRQSRRVKILQVLLGILGSVLLSFVILYRQRARIEQAAFRRSEEFRTLVEGIPDYAIFMLDPQGNVLTWNIGAERLCGYKAHAIIGRDTSRLYAPGGSIATSPHQQLRIAAESGRFQTEGWSLRKDGSRFWAHVTITPSFDPAGNLCGFIKITRNITEARESEARY